MGIFNGINEIVAIKNGINDITKVYNGINLIWPDAAPASTLHNGLISCWEFNDPLVSPQTAKDAGPNGYDLNIAQQVSVQNAGHLGTSFNNSISGYMGFTPTDDRFNPPNSISISMWIKRIGLSVNGSGTQTLISKWSDTESLKVFRIHLKDSNQGADANKIYWTCYDSAGAANTISYKPTSDIWTNKWVHVVLTRNGNAHKIYINGFVRGLLNQGTSVGRQPGTANSYFGVGNIRTSSPNDGFVGYYDQTAIWNRELLYAEQQELYNSGAGKEYVNW